MVGRSIGIHLHFIEGSCREGNGAGNIDRADGVARRNNAARQKAQAGDGAIASQGAGLSGHTAKGNLRARQSATAQHQLGIGYDRGTGIRARQLSGAGACEVDTARAGDLA
ncbi:hypothetical protein D3C80_1846630 [compost metagenome]